MTLKRSLSVAGQRQSVGIRNEKAGGERKEMNPGTACKYSKLPPVGRTGAPTWCDCRMCES